MRLHEARKKLSAAIAKIKLFFIFSPDYFQMKTTFQRILYFPKKKIYLKPIYISALGF